MARRYVGVSTVGKPTQIFDRICRVVQMQMQTQMIPAVKFEKKLRGEFYVFLAVENTEETRLPDEVLNVLQYAGLTRRPVWPIEPIEITTMTSSPELETHSLNALTYKSLWFNDLGDPFDLSVISSNERDTGDPSLGERYDQLLYWLSANAEGTWRTFARVCDILQLANDTKDARSIFRRLILLGYIESSGNGQKWSICPTTLVQCAAIPDVCFLTGQQTPKLIKQLKTHWDVKSIPQPGYQGPSCLKVHGVFPDVSINGFSLEYAGVASVRLARLLPNLEDWKDTLTNIDRFSTTKYDNIEIWDGSRFTSCDTFYERNGQYCGESGMYRLTRSETSDTYQIVLYFDQANQRWLRGDWYGLRFLAYDVAELDFEVRYDFTANDIWIPIDERWPMLYERALVLASGTLPYRPENSKWLRYSGVSNELVQLLTEKLKISIRKI